MSDRWRATSPVRSAARARAWRSLAALLGLVGRITAGTARGTERLTGGLRGTAARLDDASGRLRLRAAQRSLRAAAIEPTPLPVAATAKVPMAEATVAAPAPVFPPPGTPDATFVAPPLALPPRNLPDATIAAATPELAPMPDAPTPRAPVPPPPIAAALLDMTAPLAASALPRPKATLPAPRRTLPPPPSRSTRPPVAHVEWTAGARDGKAPSKDDPAVPARAGRALPS